MLRGSVGSYGRRADHTFSRAPQANIPRSQFNRSHGHKTTFNAGYLVPILVDEALPGDTFNLKMHAFARMATPIFPLMDNMYLETFFFSVPYRLVWDNWEKFNGFQENPSDSTDFVIPTMSAPAMSGVAEDSLADHMGIPVGIANLTYDSLFMRAYNLIWNDWFRDENLQESAVVDRDDGPDNYNDYFLLKRGKRHDYFTSCLPFPQKGPDVELPIANTAPLIVNPDNSGWVPTRLVNVPTGSLRSSYDLGDITTGSGGTAGEWTDSVSGSFQFAVDLNDNYVVNLTSATAVTIDELRLAVQTQRLYERDARGGTRYTEIIRSHFGVISPDARLQRPEYLGGGSTPIIINPIAQTSQTSGSNALGALAAYGVCAPKGHGFTKSFTEHEIVIGLVCVRADLNYQQGLERMWSRQTRFDFYWPALSHLGEQAVLYKEIYAQNDSNDDLVFGYQERYAEYRYKPSQITGLFRSAATGSLDSWHLAQDFGDLPQLNDEFIQEDPPMTRVKAVTSQPDFLFDCQFEYKCARPMPVYSVPGLMDHF